MLKSTSPANRTSVEENPCFATPGFTFCQEKKEHILKVGNIVPRHHHLFFGGLTLQIRIIQFDVVNASSRYSSLMSLFPISTPLARSYLQYRKLQINYYDVYDWSCVKISRILYWTKISGQDHNRHGSIDVCNHHVKTPSKII